MQLSYSIQVPISNHSIELLVLGHCLLFFHFLAKWGLSPAQVCLLNLLLGRGEILERRYRTVAELLKHLRFHLGLCLNLYSLQGLSRVLTIKQIILHRLVLRLSDQVLMLTEILRRKLEHLELCIGFHEELLV